MRKPLKKRISGGARAAVEAANVRRGQYLGVSIAALAMISAVLVVALDGAWQVAVALVGLPVLGAVKAIVQGRGTGSADDPGT